MHVLVIITIFAMSDEYLVSPMIRSLLPPGTQIRSIQMVCNIILWIDNFELIKVDTKYLFMYFFDISCHIWI